MRLLLDTHAFLWWVQDAPELSRKARAAITDPDNECLVSLASCWKMAIKVTSANSPFRPQSTASFPNNLPRTDFVRWISASVTSSASLAFRFITAIRSTDCWQRRHWKKG